MVIQNSDCLEIQYIDTANTPVLEDVGIPIEERSTEELIKMPLNQDESCYFLVGSFLNSAEREEMFSFLKEHIKVFAWCPSEMPRIDPSFASHSLNVHNEEASYTESKTLVPLTCRGGHEGG